jgi:hypothetical protein
MTAVAALAGWKVGLILGVVVIVIAAAIVLTISRSALAFSTLAPGGGAGVEVLEQQTTSLAGIEQINDSGVRILHSARALRKVAVGK